MADKRVAAAFKEVFNNKPSTVKKSKSAEGQRKQMVAIALSKARSAGADIPMQGGSTKLKPGSMKAEFLMGRKANLTGKAKFKTGPHARDCGDTSSSQRTDNAASEEV